MNVSHNPFNTETVLLEGYWSPIHFPHLHLVIYMYIKHNCLGSFYLLLYLSVDLIQIKSYKIVKYRKHVENVFLMNLNAIWRR